MKNRLERVATFLSKDEMETIRAAAKALGLSISAFLRMSAIDAARSEK